MAAIVPESSQAFKQAKLKQLAPNLPSTIEVKIPVRIFNDAADYCAETLMDDHGVKKTRQQILAVPGFIKAIMKVIQSNTTYMFDDLDTYDAVDEAEKAFKDEIKAAVQKAKDQERAEELKRVARNKIASVPQLAVVRITSEKSLEQLRKDGYEVVV